MKLYRAYVEVFIDFEADNEDDAAPMAAELIAETVRANPEMVVVWEGVCRPHSS